MTDPVNKPIHYNQAGIECIDAIEAMTENMSGYIAPQAANVLNDVNIQIQDLMKAKWYLERMEKRWMEFHK